MHTVVGILVFAAVLIVALAILQAAKMRGFDPVGRVAGLFAPSTSAPAPAATT